MPHSPDRCRIVPVRVERRIKIDQIHTPIIHPPHHIQIVLLENRPIRNIANTCLCHRSHHGIQCTAPKQPTPQSHKFQFRHSLQLLLTNHNEPVQVPTNVSNDRLQGKVAIVTGSVSGIGEACSCIFVREGAKITISDIDATKGDVLEAELTLGGVFLNRDVTREVSCEEAVEIAEFERGRFDIVVNKAGCRRRIRRVAEHEFVVANQCLVASIGDNPP